MGVETRQGSFQFPMAEQSIASSTQDDMDAAIQVLQKQKERSIWRFK